jgi:2-methylcitrate dehydratase PrpD
VSLAELARELRRSHCEGLPPQVAREAERSLLNVLGTSVGASRQRAVEIVLELAAAAGGDAVAPVPGRRERADAHHAALATGIAAHLDDYDDTHLVTVIHPGAASLAAGLPAATAARATGAAFLSAFALGIEAQLRAGVAMSPWHYDEGWHITGTVGPLGAAFTAGLLAGLDADRLAHAAGLACGMTLGHREAFGTMTKSFHPGKAAANGLLAVRLAAAGRTAPAGVLEAYFRALSPRSEPASVTGGLGTRWEILANTYKPYPCGIVCHPAIDAGIALSARAGPPDRVEAIAIHCNPLVVELTGNPDPKDGLQARFSTVHGAVAGLADGEVGLAQYADARVRSADLVRLRSLTRLEPDPAIPRDAVRVEVRLAGGEVLEEVVEHARGSLQRPLDDRELLDKVRRLVEPVLPGRTGDVAAAVSSLAEAPDLAALVEAVTPR